VQKAFNAFKKNQQIQIDTRDKVAEMQDFVSQKLTVKGMLAFKYNTLMSKGSRLITGKQNIKCLTMAMDALKYNALVMRVRHNFVNFRQNKIRKTMFK
jgi:hypothetical protein